MDPLAPTDPERVGSYVLLGRLGGGGMGQVYLGRSPGGRPVAVKLVHTALAADGDFRRRFAQEVEAARSVGGFYTAPVVDADPDGDPPWLVTAYVPGPSLHDAVGSSGPLPPGTVRSLGAGLAEGLAAIHACGLVHRDLKPANVILADDGPRVIDFGIARALGGSELTVTGTMVGTPGFMSPEQAMGETDISTASDVFSLGSVLAFAATGEGPFGGGSIAGIVYRIVSGQPDLTRLPDELREVVTACLVQEPSGRPSLDEVTDALTHGREATDMFTPGWLPATVPYLASDAVRAATVVVPPSDPTRAVPPPPTPGSVPTAPPTEVTVAVPRGDRTLTAPAGGEAMLEHPGTREQVSTRDSDGPANPSRRRMIIGAAGLATAAVAGVAAWAALGGDDDKPAKPPTSPAPQAGLLAWRFPTAGTVLSYPRVAGDVVYAASNDGTLYAVNTADGTERWKFRTSAAIGSAPFVVGGVVYLGSDDGKLYAVDAVSGLERWSFPTGGIVHSPVFSGGIVYVGSADGNLYAVNSDGKERWRFPTGNDTHSAVISGDVVYVGCSDTNLYAIEAFSPTKKWTAPTRGAVSGFPVVDSGVVYFGSTDGMLYAANEADGRQRWTFAGVGPQAGPVVTGGTAYIGGGSNVYAVNTGSGKETGRYAAAGDVGRPAVAAGVLYVGSKDQNLHAVDAATMQPKWKYAAPGAVQSPAVAADRVYVGVDDNTLIAVAI
ncbi:outer membrane protein assembly factor BamB family protein [Yinghuangia sp. YIM S09857]|uniref:outer membrane protein assembly factor BamB family protein n=1 Tax=Yinghuangia sp. YIM S09857 TaxID=3436929 RepID=UPI003F5384C9